MNVLKSLAALALTTVCNGAFAATLPSASAAGIPGWKLINLDIDRSVSSQKEVSALIDERMDLHAAENAIRLWTGHHGLKILRKSIAQTREKHPEDRWLTFEGSGDMHQVAATLIESLPATARPVTLILFDNHPDWFIAPERFHCGAWVVQALHHPYVEKVIMLGQNSSDIRGDQFRLAPFHQLCSGRVEMHPFLRESALVPFIWAADVKGVSSSDRCLAGTRLHFETISKNGAENTGDKLARELAGKNIYISIDKDVMGFDEALTDWNQGEMSLKEVLTIVKKVASSGNLVGMDVCGERAPEPLHGILKRFDSGRLLNNQARDFQKANQVNERTNLSIIKLLSELKTTINKSTGRGGP